MEAKINVAEILKDKPENTKLYSPLFGDVYFSYIKDSIINVKHHGGITKFFDNSRYYNYPASEPLLFPSKEMRDWSKYAWKRGDVLVSDDGCIEVIFDKWYDDTYTSFYGKHYLDSENENDIVYIEAFICTTERFSLEDKESFLCYINTIEERLGGKLNRETLEIEKTQPEFKDGDILSNPSTALPKNHIFIFSKFNKYKDFEHHVALTASGEITIPTSHGVWCRKDSGVKYATKEEKQQLFEALAEKGKAWDAEKKAIVDLKPKCEFKPFDRCIWKIRNCEGSIWQASFVSYVDEYGATPMGMSIDEDLVNLIILPYNDQTKLLVGTTDEWEGGEQ
jgi:hypothetical protein